MSETDDREVEQEERAIYWIITLAILPVVIGIFLDGGTIDGGGTLSLILVALGVTGIVAGLRVFTRTRLPRARIHRRSR
ncbi:MAG: hypothetical protein H6Q90_7220 [Deltaproteobacteria bacterium]|nr:hypothetical protein [Deltaproteobacteria bacterium]